MQALRFISGTVLATLLGLSSGAGAAEVSFRNDVMAVVSKAGCNAGACHGNANGKAGFKLSLRGEDPQWDYQILSREMFARRANPTDPDGSLLLLKATAQVAHEGGQRFKTNSLEYRILRDWIARGLPADPPDLPRVDALEVDPAEIIVTAPTNEVPLRARARFSDGSVRDVTALAVYEPASDLVSVGADGVARNRALGETTVLVRFLDRQQPVRLAFIPDRPDFAWQAPAPENFIDREVFAKLRALQMNPSERCTDHEFVRRAHLDLLGSVPSAAEARRFVAERGPDKRRRLVDVLLQRSEFGESWGLKWADLLRAEERLLDRKGIAAFQRWVNESIQAGKPLDQFARELIAARGSTYEVPAANFYRAVRNPVARAEAIAQVFLGTRLQCAQCHNHPFDRWTQNDYYDWSSLFARVQYKVIENRRRDNNDSHEFKGEQIVYVAQKGEVKNPRTGRPAVPRYLADPAEAPTASLDRLAAWVASPTNQLFARVQANRIWFHLLGRGIVDPIDDFRPTNPASHPRLLDQLAQELAGHGYDLRHLIRLIMNSQTYQLSARPNDSNAHDEMNYARAYLRRLSAEQLLDAHSQVTGVPVRFNGFPAGVRAAQVPGALPERKRDQRQAETDQFLETFGKPARLLTCECERSGETTMGQAFQLISGPTLNGLMRAPHNRLQHILAGEPEAIVDELYWTALSRPPAARELRDMTARLQKSADRRAACEDLLWALLNSKEFLFRN